MKRSVKMLGAVKEFAAKIDLGRKSDLYAEPCCKPSPSMNYPTLYVYNVKGLDKLPTSGKAVIEYEAESTTRRVQDGKVTHSADLRIKSIQPMKEEKSAAARTPASGGARPARGTEMKFSLAPELSRLHELADLRSRNPQGQYVPDQAGGADPQSMKAAYGKAPNPNKPDKRKKLAITAALLAGAGAVAGGGHIIARRGAAAALAN